MLPESGNFGDLFANRRDSGATAIVDLTGAQPREVSYAELNAGCDAVARGLRRAGLEPGDRVAVMSANSVAFVEAFFGAARAGCIPLQVNIKLPDATLATVVERGDAKLAFVDAKRRDKVPAGTPAIVLDGDGYTDFADPGPFESHRPDPSEIAFQPYTSGTTGVPKGIMMSHGGVLSGIAAMHPPQRPLDPTTRIIIAHPLYHKNAMLAAKSVFLQGGALVMFERFEVEGYLRAIQDHKVTNLQTVPTMMALIMQRRDLLDRLDLTSLRFILIGSAPLSEKLQAQVTEAFPWCMVRNGYGFTEAGVAIFGNHPDGKPPPPLSIGYVLPDCEVKLVGGPNPNQGVLYVKNPRLMAGYHKLPDVTAERLTSDGFANTGDVVRRDAEGFYYFVGRDDDMFVVGGYNLYPATVEETLLQHPAVHQAAVVAVDDEIKGTLPHAFVVPKRGQTITEDEIKQFALNEAPAYQHPRRVYVVDELPLAGTNKIDYRRLREQVRRD
ncbi:MAG: class I adenylate-forming enzyme family protein [Alphaproteobacteria bacterium]